MRVRGLYVDERGLLRCLSCRHRSWRGPSSVTLGMLHIEHRHPELLAVADTVEDLLR